MTTIVTTAPTAATPSSARTTRPGRRCTALERHRQEAPDQQSVAVVEGAEVPVVPGVETVGAEQAEGVGVPPLPAVRVPHHPRAEHAGGDRDSRADDGEQDEAGASRPQHDDDHQRPHQVELLLDRQGPEVTEQSHDGRRPVRDVHPVHEVEGHGDEAPRRGAVRRGRRGEHRGEARHEKSQEDERIQAEDPSGVEVAQADRAHSAVLPDEQRGDEEPAQHEEHVDAQPAPPHVEPGLVETRVERHHPEDRDAPQAVERGLVAERLPQPLGLPRRLVRGRGLRPAGLPQLAHVGAAHLMGSRFIPSER